MTPQEMVRAITANIETARAIMEDGPVGYVCHTRDCVHFLAQSGAEVRLGLPLDDDVAVLSTHTRAVVLQRYWNSFRKEDAYNRVIISLRREALVGYIDVQQRTLNALLEMGATK